jgi:hypothetical protein
MSGHDVPFLRAGVGQSPQEGGCIMQVISWIAHNGAWSDTPLCVLPCLRDIAIEVNDAASDEERQRLLDLAPRLINTQIADPARRAQVGLALSERYLSLSNELWDDDESISDSVVGVDGLSELLDLYDEITGRPKVTEPLDFSGVCAAMAGA